jgi:hypothetical protein
LLPTLLVSATDDLNFHSLGSIKVACNVVGPPGTLILMVNEGMGTKANMPVAVGASAKPGHALCEAMGDSFMTSSGGVLAGN